MCRCHAANALTWSGPSGSRKARGRKFSSGATGAPCRCGCGPPSSFGGALFRLAAETHRVHSPPFLVRPGGPHPLVELHPTGSRPCIEAMLTGQPLHFVRATPEGGRTIMSGLLIKEHVARGDVGSRCRWGPRGVRGAIHDPPADPPLRAPWRGPAAYRCTRFRTFTSQGTSTLCRKGSLSLSRAAAGERNGCGRLPVRRAEQQVRTVEQAAIKLCTPRSLQRRAAVLNLGGRMKRAFCRARRVADMDRDRNRQVLKRLVGSTRSVSCASE
jgi:hypothetical protein